MQIHIHFLGDAISVPIAYQRIVQGMLYAELGADSAYQCMLHNGSGKEQGRRFKGFTFGRLQGKHKKNGNRLVFPDGCSLEIRSCDAYLIQLLLAAFLPKSTHRIGSCLVTVAECHLTDNRIAADCVEIGMLSPLTVYETLPDHQTSYAAPDEERFYHLICENAERKWTELVQAPFPGSFSIHPLAVTGKDKVVTTYKGTYITGWMGTYRLIANHAVLDFLYQTGLGAKNAQGFGMFQVL